MDSRLQSLIDCSRVKFGLENYFLKRHELYREVNLFNETLYTFCMEWFPNGVEHEDEDTNPEGTAVIELNLKKDQYERVIFVGGKSYANGVRFPNHDRNQIFKWIEEETGLTYGEYFQFHKEEEGRLYFKKCINDIPLSPSSSIEIEVDQDGNLTFFSMHGPFPSEEMIKEEPYTLSLEDIEHISKVQLQLIEFPSDEQKRLIPLYAMEEIYIANNGKSTIPFEFIVNGRPPLEINKTVYWDSVAEGNPFKRKSISLQENITIEQAFSCEPSLETYPITESEQEKCVAVVQDLLCREYPSDSGKWILKTLHSEKGFIHAILRMNKQDHRVFQRKLTIIIERKSLEAINYIDNKLMLEMFEHYQASEQVTISKEEAFEKLKTRFELKPYYVFDPKQGQYRLCGKLDCHYGVNASTGEIIALRDL
ncbi:hypothetical protein [Fredinandcohnia quinoae]|uniref:Uncharacterized protein n=1 Tax=Fredinandcohnia quinoae TaxID=2918902 RepID=A0AAW5E5K8_9BACI|nr:hypothetical protein [Fredinandcohnia sp. SECRCQ15]MCH1625266.1 hypothetical protein [Fredinandcohnia sp. SECRCQ15]